MQHEGFNSAELAPEAMDRILSAVAPLTTQQLTDIFYRAQAIDRGDAQLEDWSRLHDCASSTSMMRSGVAPTTAFEIVDAAAAYDATRPGLGGEFVAQLTRTLKRIERYPEFAPAVGAGIHRADLSRFPYCIVYRTQATEIHVLGVLPRHADPHQVSFPSAH